MGECLVMSCSAEEAPASQGSPFGRAQGEDLNLQHVWWAAGECCCAEMPCSSCEDHWFFTPCAKSCLGTRQRLSLRTTVTREECAFFLAW